MLTFIVKSPFIRVLIGFGISYVVVSFLNKLLINSKKQDLEKSEDPEEQVYLSWNIIEEIKEFINSEFKKRNLEILWEPGEMAYDIADFNTEKFGYHMFVSSRQNNTFGFGVFMWPNNYKTLINESIPYDSEYKDKIIKILDQIE